MYEEDDDIGSELEDESVSVHQIMTANDDNNEDTFMDHLEDVFRSINEMNDEELRNVYESVDQNFIFSKEGRPYTDYCHLNQENNVPFNDNVGCLNYDNLPDQINSLQDVFKLFMTDEILELIVKYTNIHSTIERDDFLTDKQSLLNFIGILIYQSANKDNELPISHLWSKFNASPFYYATSSRTEFEKHLEHIRFDDRRQRLTDEMGYNVDKIAPIREIADLFKATLPKYFTPSKEVTIDETVSKFTGRSPIKVYAGSLKPNSYGFLFRWLCDANNIFMLNFEIYAGKSTSDKSVSSLMEKLIVEAGLANKGKYR